MPASFNMSAPAQASTGRSAVAGRAQAFIRGALKGILAVCVALPTYFLALPVLLLFRLLFYLGLEVPCKIASCISGSRQKVHREAMRVEDSFQLMETSTNRCNIVAQLDLSGPALDVESLRQLWAKTFLACRSERSAEGSSTDMEGGRAPLLRLRWPRFRQRPVRRFGMWYWEDMGNFDLESHVQELQGISDKESLAAALASLQSEPMSRERPLWDLWLVKPGLADSSPSEPGLTGSSLSGRKAGVSTIVVRVHHAMGDGVSLSRVLLEGISGSWKLGFSGAASVGHRGSGSGIVAIAKVAMMILLTPLLSVQQLLLPKDRGELKPQQLSGKKHAAFAQPVDLARVKAVAKVYGSTITAVTSACFARALSLTCAPSGRGTKFWLPVSLSAARGNTEAILQNDLCFLMMPLAVQASSVSEALHVADQRIRDVKSSVEAPALLRVIQATLFLLPLAVADWLLNTIGDKASGVLSSLPGPVEAIRWDGFRVESIAFLVPQRSKFAVGLSAMSYNGKLQVAVCGDTAALRDPARVADGWQAALQELEAEAPRQ